MCKFAKQEENPSWTKDSQEARQRPGGKICFDIAMSTIYCLSYISSNISIEWESQLSSS